MVESTEKNIPVLGVKLVDTSNNILDVTKNLDVINSDDGILFKFDNDKIDDYEELGQAIGRFELGIISNGNFIPSEKLLKAFAESQDVDVEELNLTYIPEIGDFIEDNLEEIQKITNTDSISTDDELSTEIEKLAESTPIEENMLNYPQNATEEQPIETPINNQILDFTNDIPETSQDDTNSGKNEIPPRGNIDPLLSLAADIFENNVEATLPVFDEYTTKQLQGSIVKSQMTVHNARDKAIFDIYRIIKEHKGSIDNEFYNNFSKYTEEHEQVIKTLKDNEKKKVSKERTDSDNSYKEQQDEYVRSQESTLRDAYDAQHKEEHLKSLEIRIDEIHKQTDKDIDTETTRYEEALGKEKVRYLERRFRQLDYADIISNFNTVVADENKYLLEKSSDFKDQVGILTAKLVKERDEFKREAETQKRAREVLKDSMSTQIDSESKRQAEQLAIQAIKDRDDAVNKANEYNAKNQQVITSLNESLTSEREKNGILTQRLQELSELNQKKIAEATPQEFTPRNETSKKKTGATGLIVSTILIIISIIGLFFGGYIFVNSNSSDNSQSAQKSVTSIQSSTEKHNYSSGDTWQYKASDGNTYKVTMDNSHVGTYVDKEGNTHKIELK